MLEGRGEVGLGGVAQIGRDVADVEVGFTQHLLGHAHLDFDDVLVDGHVADAAKSFTEAFGVGSDHFGHLRHGRRVAEVASNDFVGGVEDDFVKTRALGIDLARELFVGRCRVFYP